MIFAEPKSHLKMEIPLDWFQLYNSKSFAREQILQTPYYSHLR